MNQVFIYVWAFHVRRKKVSSNDNLKSFRRCLIERKKEGFSHIYYESFYHFKALHDLIVDNIKAERDAFRNSHNHFIIRYYNHFSAGEFVIFQELLTEFPVMLVGFRIALYV